MNLNGRANNLLRQSVYDHLLPALSAYKSELFITAETQRSQRLEHFLIETFFLCVLSVSVVKSPNSFTAETQRSQRLENLFDPTSYLRALRAFAVNRSLIFDLRLAPHVRSYFLDERVFVDRLGDVAGTAGSQSFLAIALHCK